jgi:peroxiredoxin
LEILAVNLQEDEGTISRFADEFGVEFPIAIDRSGAVADEYRLFGVPTTFFIDREGVIASVYRGPRVGEDRREAIERSELERRIEEILDEGS